MSGEVGSFKNPAVRHSSLRSYAKFYDNLRTTIEVTVKHGLLFRTRCTLFEIRVTCPVEKLHAK